MYPPRDKRLTYLFLSSWSKETLDHRGPYLYYEESNFYLRLDGYGNSSISSTSNNNNPYVLIYTRTHGRTLYCDWVNRPYPRRTFLSYLFEVSPLFCDLDF